MSLMTNQSRAPEWILTDTGSPPESIPVIGCCLLDEAHPTDRNFDVWSCENSGPLGSFTALTRQYLLVKLKYPWKAPSSVAVAGKWMELFVAEWADVYDIANVSDSAMSPNHFDVCPVTETFDPTGASAPSWNDVMVTGHPAFTEAPTKPYQGCYSDVWAPNSALDLRWFGDAMAHWPESWTGANWAGFKVYGLLLRPLLPTAPSGTTWYKILELKKLRSKVLLTLP